VAERAGGGRDIPRGVAHIAVCAGAVGQDLAQQPAPDTAEPMCYFRG
jgi:hypothetical protein